MSTTTMAAIRDEQLRLVEAVTPTSVQSTKFRRAQEDVPFEDFRDWAQRSAAASFRRFAIADQFGYGRPLASNTDVEYVTATATVLVAYPHSAQYGPDNQRDRDDVVRQDMNAIDSVLGHRGNAGYTEDAAVVCIAKSVETAADVTFLVMLFEIQFWESYS